MYSQEVMTQSKIKINVGGIQVSLKTTELMVIVQIILSAINTKHPIDSEFRTAYNPMKRTRVIDEDADINPQIQEVCI
tara:strand:+ start:1214 stop:1447 length:234 start_codon:yes stop_codon:yes gene_type:complete